LAAADGCALDVPEGNVAVGTPDASCVGVYGVLDVATGGGAGGGGAIGTGTGAMATGIGA
jgi:hypothetical protein